MRQDVSQNAEKVKVLKDLELLAQVFKHHKDAQGVDWQEERVLDHFLCKIMPSWNPEQWPEADRVNKYGTAYLTKSFLLFTNAIVTEDKELQEEALRRIEEEEKHLQSDCFDSPDHVEPAPGGEPLQGEVGGLLAPGADLSAREAFQRVGAPVDRIFPWRNIRAVSENVRHRTHDQGCFVIDYCEGESAQPLPVCFLVIWKEPGKGWLSVSTVTNSWQPQNARTMVDYVWKYPPLYARVTWPSLEATVDAAVAKVSMGRQGGEETRSEKLGNLLVACSQLTEQCKAIAAEESIEASVRLDLQTHCSMAENVITLVRQHLEEAKAEDDQIVQHFRSSLDVMSQLYEMPTYEPDWDGMATDSPSMRLPVVYSKRSGIFDKRKLRPAELVIEGDCIYLVQASTQKVVWGPHNYSKVVFVLATARHQHLTIATSKHEVTFFTSHLQFIANEIRIRCKGQITVRQEPGTRSFQHSMLEIRSEMPQSAAHDYNGTTRDSTERQLVASTAAFDPLLRMADELLNTTSRDDEGFEALIQNLGAMHRSLLFVLKHNGLEDNASQE